MPLVDKAIVRLWPWIARLVVVCFVSLLTAVIVGHVLYMETGREAVQRGYAIWVIRPGEPADTVWRWIEVENENE